MQNKELKNMMLHMKKISRHYNYTYYISNYFNYITL
jgi:hypothetical protein